jgi:hypothetical protein
MSIENERYVSNRVDRIEHMEEQVKISQLYIEKLEKELDNARFIIERAYFDTFDPFHRKLELTRIDWLNNNKRK